MQIKWINPDCQFDKSILAGDVGGTNTNLAIVAQKGDIFTVILEVIFSSSEINGLIDPLKKVLEIAREKRHDLTPSRCCISAAGAVINNRCNLTNCGWNIDGAEIEKELGIKTLLIKGYGAGSFAGWNGRISTMKNRLSSCRILMVQFLKNRRRQLQ